MDEINVVAFASTLALIDLILHPLFHLWVTISPRSYEHWMHLSVAGLHLKVDKVDTKPRNIFISTLIEAAAFWLLGASIATFYNWLV